MIGHKSLSTKRLMVESLSDIETSVFKALLKYHFVMLVTAIVVAEVIMKGSFSDRLWATPLPQI